MRNIGIPGAAGGERAIMEALRTPLRSIRATTDPITMDLRPTVAAELGHQPMLSAMAPAAAVAVRRLAVIRAVQAVRPVRVPLVHVQELHLQAR